MTYDADLSCIYPWSREYDVNGACKVKWLQAPVCLLALALTDTAKVEAQGDHPCLGQAPGKSHRNYIIHITASWLGMAEHDNGSLFYL